MYRKQVRRRRAVLVALVVASLVLLSISFSEADSGPLHSIQRGVSAALSPIEEGASRALKPIQDLINWFDETFDARGENEELRAEVSDLRDQVAAGQSAIGENDQFRKLLQLDRANATLAAYERVTGRVIGRSPTVWYATVSIDVGSGEGVEVNDPVVTGDGLVGRISDTTRGSSQVTLISDHRSAVSATLLPDGPDGVVEPEVGDPDDLLLDFIDNEEEVKEGQILITAGWSNGRISSAYPYGLEIGRVSEATVGERETFQQVHVEPFADLRDLDYVQILSGGPGRPGVRG
jgi:rod shape-determining protein MreC